jgi:hypothetical protein
MLESIASDFTREYHEFMIIFEGKTKQLFPVLFFDSTFESFRKCPARMCGSLPDRTPVLISRSKN